MLILKREDRDCGFKACQCGHLTTFSTIFCCYLESIFWKGLGYNEGNFVTKGDLIDKIKSYGLGPARAS